MLCAASYVRTLHYCTLNLSPVVARGNSRVWWDVVVHAHREVVQVSPHCLRAGVLQVGVTSSISGGNYPSTRQVHEQFLHKDTLLVVHN